MDEHEKEEKESVLLIKIRAFLTFLDAFRVKIISCICQ